MSVEHSDLLQESYAFDHFVLDAQRRELRGPDGPIEVQRKVLHLLFFLARHCSRAVSKDELLEAVWPGTVVSESVLSQAVRKARGALGDDGASQQLIRTVHGHGYQLQADVRPLQASGQIAAAPAAEQPSAAAPEQLTPVFDALDRPARPDAAAEPDGAVPEPLSPTFAPLGARTAACTAPTAPADTSPQFGTLPPASPRTPVLQRARVLAPGGRQRLLLAAALIGAAAAIALFLLGAR